MFKLFSEAKLILQKPQSWFLVISAFLIPFVLFYLLFNVSGKMIEEQINGISKRKYKVAWISSKEQAMSLKDKMKIHLQLQLIENMDELQAMEAIKNDSISLAIVLVENFDSSIAQKKTADIKLIFKGENRALSIVEKMIKNYKNEIIKNNLKEINLPEGLVIPIEVTERDMSNNQEIIDNVYKMMNNSLALILSVLFLVFGLWGSRYALNSFFKQDIEKQHYALKILSSTAMSAKMMFFAFMGFLLALNLKQTGIMEGIMIQLRELFSLSSIALLCIAAFCFAAFLTALSNLLYLGLKKPVSNILLNLMLFVIIIVFITVGSSPTELNYFSALNPFSSLVLISKQLISGEYNLTLISVSWLATVAYGLILLVIVSKKYKAEP